jgi:DNA-binding NtrC family response regulator
MSHVVLIAEDDAATLDGLAGLLCSAGLRVAPVSNFADAHRLMPFLRPHLLITDIRLGQYNGLQLVVQAGTLEPPPAVIVTSGFDDPVLIAEAQRMGATYVRKPVEPGQLTALVSEMLKR